MTMGYLAVVSVLLCALFTGSLAVKVVPCGNKDPSSFAVQVTEARVTPHPVVVPGDMTLTLSMKVNRPITGRLTADVDMHKSLGPFWMRVPCMSTPFGKVGSCTYNDVCNQLPANNNSCPRVMLINNLPCSCPFEAATYTLPPTVFPVSLRRASFLNFAITGSYRATVRLTDSMTREELTCYDVSVTLDDPPRPGIGGGITGILSSIFG